MIPAIHFRAAGHATDHNRGVGKVVHHQLVAVYTLRELTTRWSLLHLHSSFPEAAVVREVCYRCGAILTERAGAPDKRTAAQLRCVRIIPFLLELTPLQARDTRSPRA